MRLGVGFATLLAASQAALTFGVSVDQAPRALCLLDQSGRHRLTGITTESAASWSPDGTQYVYEGTDTLGIANAHGDTLRALDPPDTGELRYDPAWSPRGDWIAFVTGYYGQAVELVSPDGTRSARVPGAFGGLESKTSSPTWAPGGTELDYAYSTSDPGAGASGIYSIGIDGSNKHLVVANGEEPQLSPDGTKLAYVKTTWVGTTRTTHDLFVADANGSNEERLTATAALDEQFPAWSPDGSRLAFAVGTVRIDELDLARGTERTVVRAVPGYSLTPPSWRPASTVPAGGAQQCVIEGTQKADTLTGTKHDDIIAGGNGNDTIHGGLGNDIISGGRGHDHLYGDPGNDLFFAQDRWLDWIDGGPGNDTAYCDYFDNRRSLEQYCYL